MRSIEGARALAALSVAVMHCANLMRVDQFSGHVGLGGIFEFGYVGVDFFFVLSGFIITYVHYFDIGDPRSIPRYLWRRLTRIYPIFWVCLILSVAFLVAGRVALGKSTGIEFSVDDLINTVFLIKILDDQPKFIGVAWTLQFEVMFYVSFCAVLLSRRFGLVFFAAWLMLIVVDLMGAQLPTKDMLFTNAHCTQFMMGVGVGLLTRSRSFATIKPVALLLALAALLLAIFYEMQISPQQHGSDGRIVLGMASALTLFCLVELEKKSMIRTPKFLYQIGSVSYSIYLSHILFINLIFSVLLKIGVYHKLPELAIFLIGLLGALSCAIALGLLVELRLVSYLKRLYDHFESGRKGKTSHAV